MLANVEPFESYVVIVAPSEIDVLTGPAFHAQIMAPAAQSDVVINMAGVTFCDSVGVRAIVNGLQRFTAGGGSFRLRDPSPVVLRLLEISGLSDRIPLEATER